MRHFAVLSLSLALVACQSQVVTRDFDASRDFASYRSWSWKEPALQYLPDDPRIKSDLTEQRVREAVSEQLDQRGLRPTATGSKADVNVQAYLIVENRQQQISSYRGGWGGYWGGGPWGGGPMFNETRTLEYRVATLQIDLLDGRDGKLVWRGSAEQIMNDASEPGERSAAIYKSVAKVLSAYPPH